MSLARIRLARIRLSNPVSGPLVPNADVPGGEVGWMLLGVDLSWEL